MKLDFEKGGGLLPAIVQDAYTGKVLMLGYMNKEALKKTQKKDKVTFYSRSKKRLWTKGETSGNYLLVKEIIPDCDNDTLLIKAVPTGPACHTGSETCFNEKNSRGFLYKLQATIGDRKRNPKTNSYTNKLLSRGINKIAQKVGEEATELIIEAKDEDKNLFLNEAADLLYHFMVLLEAKNCDLQEVEDILKERHMKKK